MLPETPGYHRKPIRISAIQLIFIIILGELGLDPGKICSIYECWSWHKMQDFKHSKYQSNEIFC